MIIKSFINYELSLKPELLNSNIMSNILQECKEKVTKKCFSEYGIVMEILKINKIKSNIISRNTANIIVYIELVANCIKPEKNSILTLPIYKIIDYGILININDKLMFLIPLSYFKDYVLNKEDNTICKEDIIIKESDNIKFKVINVKFDGEKFNGIGKPVE